MSALEGLTLTDRPKKSGYAIVERDAHGKAIGAYPFEPKEISDLPPAQRLASIDEVVPFSAKAKRSRSSRATTVLVSQAASRRTRQR